MTSGCSSSDTTFRTDITGRVNPWTDLEFGNKPENFQFVIVSDRTGGHRPGVFADAIGKINLLRPEFVICIGDLIEGYTEDKEEIGRQWQEFDDLIERLQMPFFYVPGNHDIANQQMLDEWNRRFGRPYYHFIYHNVLFLCLDTEGGYKEHKESQLSDEQIEYFRGVLSKNPNVRWTLIFLHRPLWEHDNQSWLEFEELLTESNYTVFAGHEHQYAMNIRNGRKFIRLATTGGNSSLNGTTVGAFDHIVWATMTDYGPLLANLLLDGIYDENVTPYHIASAAKFLKEKIDSGEVIQSEPITIDQEMFTEGITKLKFTNFSPLPMKVKGRFKSRPNLSTTPQSIDTTVLPLLFKTIDVKVKASAPIKAQDLLPLEFEAAITYEFPGKEPITAKIPGKVIFKKQADSWPMPTK
ncbi:MAG: metallophosphoesterase [Sedimentisphaerales bacterium]|nr:metallophosphoesterase [Sedimentisphaerales bacterium]